MKIARVATALLLGALLPRAAAGQALAASVGAGTPCAYADCALGIVPVWNGLAVARGREREPVATLGFFWPRDVSAHFTGDSARTYAARAFRTRRVAATLTDAGALLLAAGALRGAMSGRVDGVSRALLATGAGAFGSGVPLQFSADGLLSRAVWWHNAAYGREGP